MCLVIWLAVVFAVPARLMASLERSVPSVNLAEHPPFEAAVVLGGGWSPSETSSTGLEANDSFDRLLAGLDALRDGHAHVLLIGGGEGLGASMTDGQVAMRWIERFMPELAHGVVVLPPSANTREEAVHTAEWASTREPSDILLVTSAWHMPRALHNFERRGLEVVPLPCDYSGVPVVEARKEKGPDWLPSLGHLGEFQRWLTEVVGRWMAR